MEDVWINSENKYVDGALINAQMERIDQLLDITYYNDPIVLATLAKTCETLYKPAQINPCKPFFNEKAQSFFKIYK